MEIMTCPECNSMNMSEDILTRDHTCLVCGRVSKGTLVDFYGVRENEKIVRHSPRFNPFGIQNKIRLNNDPNLKL